MQQYYYSHNYALQGFHVVHVQTVTLLYTINDSRHIGFFATTSNKQAANLVC